jgi:hypothetical protein
MASGKHTSVRVALAVPPKIHEQLSAWAEYEGRPLASLCMYLIEQSLREAQTKGIAPSFRDESNKEGDGGWVKEGPEPDDWVKQLGRQATDDYEKRQQDQLSRDVNEENEINTAVGREAAKGKYIKPVGEMTKKEKLLTAISEALFD